MWSKTCQAKLMHVSVGTAGGGRMVSPRHLASRTFFFLLLVCVKPVMILVLGGSGFNVLREREAGRKAYPHTRLAAWYQESMTRAEHAPRRADHGDHDISQLSRYDSQAQIRKPT